MIQIGPYTLKNPVILAPMAGVTDRPFRQLCTRLGAGMVVSEMINSNPQCRQSKRSTLRMDHHGEVSPRIIQIAGGDPKMMADAARHNVDHGAEIIDINMGCPAKKVCNKAAGSALLKNESLVQQIIFAVVNAVNIPVTLKIRTGWDMTNKNGKFIAKIAEDNGIQALAVHGRTRADKFQGQAEYDTIAEIKNSIKIPVFANGDINTPEDAKSVLNYTNADAIMIGRAAQGHPYIFREINHYLQTGERLAPPSNAEICATLLEHLNHLYGFYGEFMGPRIARKHVGWYLKTINNNIEFRRQFNKLDTAESQIQQIKAFFS